MYRITFLIVALWYGSDVEAHAASETADIKAILTEWEACGLPGVDPTMVAALVPSPEVNLIRPDQQIVFLSHQQRTGETLVEYQNCVSRSTGYAGPANLLPLRKISREMASRQCSRQYGTRDFLFTPIPEVEFAVRLAQSGNSAAAEALFKSARKRVRRASAALPTLVYSDIDAVRYIGWNYWCIQYLKAVSPDELKDVIARLEYCSRSQYLKRSYTGPLLHAFQLRAAFARDQTPDSVLTLLDKLASVPDSRSHELDENGKWNPIHPSWRDAKEWIKLQGQGLRIIRTLITNVNDDRPVQAVGRFHDRVRFLTLGDVVVDACETFGGVSFGKTLQLDSLRPINVNREEIADWYERCVARSVDGKIDDRTLAAIAAQIEAERSLFGKNVEKGDLTSVKTQLLRRPWLANNPSTPLALAIRNADVPMAGLLVRNGADANRIMGRTADLNTPLSAAVFHALTAVSGDQRRNMIDITKMLLASGANAKVACFRRGSSALLAALMARDFQLVGLLIRGGCDPNDGINGACPLHWAVARGDFDLSRFLVWMGADVNVRTFQNATPLYLAALLEIDPIETFLIDQGAMIGVSEAVLLGRHDALRAKGSLANVVDDVTGYPVAVLASLVMDETAANVIEKSGGTVEADAISVSRESGHPMFAFRPLQRKTSTRRLLESRPERDELLAINKPAN